MARDRRGAPGVARGGYDEGRTARVEVLASPGEVRAWRAAARREGVTLGAWVRGACTARLARPSMAVVLAQLAAPTATVKTVRDARAGEVVPTPPGAAPAPPASPPRP